ncbi:MAG: protoporphyrinogen oxidase [Bacteroidota bacterium]
MASVAILGGGISGLIAGYLLDKAGIPFTLFEAESVVGGKIRTTLANGFLVEHGPNSLQSTTPLLNQLIEETGLNNARVFASSKAKKRFVVRGGTPHALPMSPPALLRSRFFSISTKLGLLKEPFKSKRKDAGEESVAAFFKRRLGQEILDYAVDPFVTGIFAGDPAALSLQHAFPTLHNLEQKHGSLLKGLRASRQSAHDIQPTKRMIFSFTEGMQMLPHALAAPIKSSIKLNCRISRVTLQQGKWTVTTDQGHAKAFDAVLNTLPLPAALPCFTGLPIDLQPFARVTYPPVTVFALGFHKEDVQHPLDGFGMLVPGKEMGARILGTIFSSMVFPNRAPNGQVLLTTLVGGARKGDLCGLDDGLILDFVLDDLHHMLGVSGNPVFTKLIPWPNAIPQYNMGYGRVKELIASLEDSYPGLFFAGNYKNGISVGDAAKSGEAAAQQIIRHFA